MPASTTFPRVKLSNSEKIGFISNFSTLLGAGIPILDAVNSLGDDAAKGGQKRILDELRSDLMQGKRIYQSLAKFPRVFDKITVNLIRASEEAGTLEVTLKDLRDHIQQEMEFTDKVKFALLYPIVIFFVFIGVLVMILVVVVPKLTTVFEQLAIKLPLSTRILIGASAVLTQHTLYFIAGLLSVIIVSHLIYHAFKAQILELIFSLPLISNLVKQIDMTRFSRSLYLLLTSGVPINNALDLAADVVIRKSTAAVILKAKTMIMAGKKFSEGLKDSQKNIPKIMIRLIDAGERSGTLDRSLQEISNYLSYQVANSLRAITVLIEPIMLLIIGLAVGSMMLAIIGPIYSLVGQVKVK